MRQAPGMPVCATRGQRSRAAGKPSVLVLTSEKLFPEFFPDPVRAAMTDVCFWELRTDSGDSPRLREAVAASDAIITTWLSPFLHTVMRDAARVKLVAYCGRTPAESPQAIGSAAVEAISHFFGGQGLESVSFETLARISPRLSRAR